MANRKEGTLALKLFSLEYAALPLKQLKHDQLKLPNSPVMQSFLGSFTEKCCGILLENDRFEVPYRTTYE